MVYFEAEIAEAEGFLGGSTLQTSSSVIAAELAQLKSRANWT